MQSGVTIAVVDRIGASEFSPASLLASVSTDLVMVLTLGTTPYWIMRPTPVHTLGGPMPLPVIGPQNTPIEAQAIAGAVAEAKRVRPWDAVHLVMFTDPAREAELLAHVIADPAVRPLRPSSAQLAPAIRSVAPPAPTPPPQRKGLLIAVSVVATVATMGLIVAVLALTGVLGPRTEPIRVTAAGTSAAATTPAPVSPTTTAARPSTTQPPQPDLTGQWSGPVVGDRTSYDIELNIQTNQPIQAMVTYPQLSCSGRWVETSRSGNQIQITETITYGIERCKQTVQITVRPEGNQLVMQFNAAAGQTASARLTRR